MPEPCGLQQRPFNLVLAGLGPCARSNYFPLLEQLTRQGAVQLRLLIELEEQELATEEFLAARSVRPSAVVYAPLAARDATRLPYAVATQLDRLRASGELDGLIIATEPKSHLAYLEWATRAGVSSLVEKPILAAEGIGTDVEVSQRMMRDLARLLENQKTSSAAVSVMAQRRYHTGYEFVRRYLHDFLRAYRVPISLIEILHSDGQWNMPSEFAARENHPYRYGYGKLLHGGYHFVDLLLWLQQINEVELGVTCDSASVFTETFDVGDALAQIDGDRYDALLGSTVAWPGDGERASMDAYGELDSYNLVRMRSGGRTVTTGLVHVVSNSFSRRAWRDLPADQYRANGRVKHERMHLAVGPLLNIQVHSYESYESAKAAPPDAPARGFVGGADHFEVLIFRNAGICGGPAFERHSFGELGDGEPSLVQSARNRCVAEFLSAEASRSPLADHERTMALITAMYRNIAKARAGDVPLTEVAFASGRRAA